MPVTSAVDVNGRTYAAPRSCAVAICLDGCEPAYLDAAIERGLMPNLARIRAEGTDSLAHSVIPSFTNPNNMSIANIQQRVAGNDGAMMNDVDPLILERARLQNYNAADVLTPYVDQIPLNEPEFRIVHADLAGTRYERQTSKLLLVVLFTSVGVLLTIIFLLAQLAIQQRDSDEKAA